MMDLQTMVDTKSKWRRTKARVLGVAAVLAMLVAVFALAACTGPTSTVSGGSQQSSSSSAGAGKISMGQVSVKAPAECKTTGFAIEPRIGVYYNGERLVKGADYEVSYKNNKKPGMGRIIIKGLGNFEGTAVKYFKISGRYNPRILVLDKSRNSASGMISFLSRCGCRTVFTKSTDVDISKYDGLAIPGGGDVDPAFYGEENLRSHRVYTWLDEIQMEMIKTFAEAGKPVFGICRGAQVINVAFGGSLYQHIENGHDGTFPTAIKKGSWLYGLFGDQFLAFHGHHQAIRDLGEGLEATEWSRKNEFRVIEMVEHSEYPIWGVQYHPEVMGKSGDVIGVRFRAECLRLMDE